MAATRRRKSAASGAATLPPLAPSVTKTAKASPPWYPMVQACVAGGTSVPCSAVPVAVRIR